MTSNIKCKRKHIDNDKTSQEESTTRTKHACCDKAEHEKNFVEMCNAKSKSIHTNTSLFDKQ